MWRFAVSAARSLRHCGRPEKGDGRPTGVEPTRQSISRPRLSPVRTRWLPRSQAASLQPTPHPILPSTTVDTRPPSKGPARRALLAPACSPPLPVEPRPPQTASLLILPLLWRWQNRLAPPEPQRRQACRRAARSARDFLGAARRPAVGSHALELPIPGCRGRTGGGLYSPVPGTMLQLPRLVWFLARGRLGVRTLLLR